MTNIKENLDNIKSQIGSDTTLVAVSKTKPIEDLEVAYNSGQRIFGENKVQELVDKHEKMNKDIKWHMIGHLQTNKVKYIAPFVSLIHSVDSLKLAKEINKQALKNFILLGIFLGLGFLSKYATIYFVICLFVLILFDKRFRKIFLDNLFGFCLTFLLKGLVLRGWPGHLLHVVSET